MLNVFSICDGISCGQLSVKEYERVQTLPVDYTKGFSNTQRFKCIGNGWTINVISHILSNLPINNKQKGV